MKQVLPIKKDQKGNDRIAGVVLTYADCNNRILHSAFEKLDAYTEWSGEDLTRWNKIKNAFDIHSKEVAKLFKKLVDKHAEREDVTHLDEATGKQVPVLLANGKVQTKPVMVPTGAGRMDFLFKDVKAFNADYKQLMSEEFKIEAYRLMTDDLRKSGLTPKEIRACGKILSDADPDLVEVPVEAEDQDDDDTAEDAPNSDANASESSEATNDHPGNGNVPTGNSAPQ